MKKEMSMSEVGRVPPTLVRKQEVPCGNRKGSNSEGGPKFTENRLD